MRRRLLNLLTLLSLLLCVAVVVLWVRSYSLTEALRLTRNHALVSDNGDVILAGPTPAMADSLREGGNSVHAPRWRSKARSGTEEQDLYMEGFKSEAGRWGFVIGPADFFVTRVYALAPWWSLAVLFGVPPALRAGVAGVKRVKAARRIPRQLCPTCGYDLRATTGRCPECGTTNQPKP